MERNPSFTKEKADFIFNKIKSYYEQNAYKLVISEYENNKELIGSVLNIGSQLKLNKYISTSILNLLIDAFEVDGNLSLFNDLWNKYHTNLEIHNSKENYQLVYKYYTEKEKNKNFKSKTEYLNKDIPVDDSSFDDIIKLSLKTSNKKTKSAEQIEQDFLNSIEKPTYMFSLVEDDDIEQSYEKIIKSNVDDDAIKEDFFSSIKSPTINKSQDSENFEQLSFNDTTNYETPKNTKEQKNKPKKKRNSNTENQTAIDLNTTTSESDYKNKLDPISIDNTILAKKEDDAIKRLKTKINSIENKSNKKDEPTKETSPDDSSVLAQRTFVKDGKKGTHTVYKSGARVTEITIETGISTNDENKKQDTGLKSNTETSQKNSRSNRRSKISSKKNSTPNGANRKVQTSSSSSKTNSVSKKNKENKRAKKQKKSGFKYILFTLLIIIIAIGGYYYRDNVFATLSNLSNSLNSAIAKQPNTNEQNNNDNNNNSDENQQSSDTIEEDPLDTPPIEPEEPKDPEATYILPSHEREITTADMANMSRSEVRYALNEMFARHGWHFGQSGDFYNYFMEQSWYKPDLTLQTPFEAEKKMSELEVKNLVTIKARYDSMR